MPETIERNVTHAEIAAICENYVASCISGSSNRCLGAVSYSCTVTSDFGFVIDKDPESERVIKILEADGKPVFAVRFAVWSHRVLAAASPVFSGTGPDASAYNAPDYPVLTPISLQEPHLSAARS